MTCLPFCILAQIAFSMGSEKFQIFHDLLLGICQKCFRTVI